MNNRPGDVLKNRRRDDKLFGFRWFSKVCIVLFMIAWFVITYWLFWPYEPLVLDGQIKVLNSNNQVVAGDFLSYEYDVDKRMDLTAIVHKQLINTLVINYTPTSSNIPLGKRTVRGKTVIPSYAEPGKYRIRIEAIYKINHFRDFSIVGWSDSFDVIKKANSLTSK